MFNNPYMYQSFARPSLLSRLFGGASAARTGAGAVAATTSSGINWGNILANTQKSLGIINQAIPLVYQVKPMINNAKTMFKLAGAIKSGDTSSSSSSSSKGNYETSSSNGEKVKNSTFQSENKPIFYI